MFKLFFAPRMAKIYYKQTKDKREKRILEAIYDFYYHKANQIEKELIKTMLERGIKLDGREQSALIIREVNIELINLGKERGYPEKYIELFLQ